MPKIGVPTNPEVIDINPKIIDMMITEVPTNSYIVAFLYQAILC